MSFVVKQSKVGDMLLFFQHRAKHNLSHYHPSVNNHMSECSIKISWRMMLISGARSYHINHWYIWLHFLDIIAEGLWSARFIELVIKGISMETLNWLLWGKGGAEVVHQAH